MSLPTVNDVQAVEPILQNLLIGYMQDQSRFVAARVFPAVMTDKDSGTYYIFTKKYWFLAEMEQRAPGGDYPIGDLGVETGTYTTLQWALAASIADEVRANSQIPMDLERAKTEWLAQQSLLRKELSFSADFMKTSVWGTDNTTATDWDDFTAGDPRNDVSTAVRTISDNTGQTANTLVMGNIVEQALLLHPDILDVLKYTTATTQSNVSNALAAVLGVSNIHVGRAVYSNTNEAAAFSKTNIIDDDCLVCYVAPTPGIMTASAGYTFAWPGGGGMGTMQPKFRDEKNQRDLLRIKEQWDQAAVATDLGYFFSDIV